MVFLMIFVISSILFVLCCFLSIFDAMFGKDSKGLTWSVIILSIIIFFSFNAFDSYHVKSRAIIVGLGKYNEKSGKFEWVDKKIKYIHDFWMTRDNLKD